MEATIKLVGTPAEEGGSGKVYLARAGVFDDVDVVLHGTQAIVIRRRLQVLRLTNPDVLLFVGARPMRRLPPTAEVCPRWR